MTDIDELKEVQEGENLPPRIEDLPIGTEIEIIAVKGEDTSRKFKTWVCTLKERGEITTMATAIIRTLGFVKEAIENGNVSEAKPARAYVSTYRSQKNNKIGRCLVGKPDKVVDLTKD